MECDACGSRNVARKEIEGFLLEECNLCGNLQGDDDAVARIEELRAGRKRGLEDDVVALVSALERTGCFRVEQATVDPPALLFSVVHGDLPAVERLMRTVELANRETKLRWLIELSLQHGLVHILRPRFWKPPAQITAAEIELARADLRILGRRLRRDTALAWWREE